MCFSGQLLVPSHHCKSSTTRRDTRAYITFCELPGGGVSGAQIQVRALSFSPLLFDAILRTSAEQSRELQGHVLSRDFRVGLLAGAPYFPSGRSFARTLQPGFHSSPQTIRVASDVPPTCLR